MNIDACIKKMTLHEKAAMLQGWTTWTTFGLPRLQIPEIFLSDGPHGLRKQTGSADNLGMNPSHPATCFPTSATMANAWDPALGEELGRALGKEAAAADVNVVLGPGLNMKRSPLCGRNFEYFSEDPYLAGKMAAAYIRGIQENGVVACPKHFAANSQELRRMSQDSVLDERTLREIYLTGFEIAVKEGKAKAIMTSYNMVNGTYANENAHLITDILRGAWGFEGFVVSDWGGDNDHVEGVRAGANLVMPAPGECCAADLVDAVESGRIEERIVDDRVRELLTVILSTAEAVKQAPKTYDPEAHHALARKCAESAIVLLDNDGILPLNIDKTVAFVGDFAQTPRYQGSGSSIVNPTQVDNLLDCAKAAGMTVTGFAPGYSRTDPNPQPQLIEAAVNTAKSADVVLLCVGLDEIAESEGADRPDMKLSAGQYALIDAVCAAHKNVVLVLTGGSPFVMPKRELYRAAVHGYLHGQAGAGAMIDVLLGKVNPSGKLSESWPHALEDNPSHPYFPAQERTAEYREGLYIGYRYYDTAKVPVRYPFGHGLSYTSFRYENIKADAKSVTFTLTNTGKTDGAEVAQVYVSCRNGKVFRPKKELKGFAKVFLKAGESKTVTVPLDDKAFRYWNTAADRWETETANYDICVASSVSDVRLTATIRICGAEGQACDLPSYRSGNILCVSDEEFTALLGRPIPDSRWSGEITRNDAICQLYYARSFLARFIHKIFVKLIAKSEKTGRQDLNLTFAFNMPIRGLSKYGKFFTSEMVDDFVLICNGHFFRGAGRMIRDFFRAAGRIRAFRKKLKEGPTDC